MDNWCRSLSTHYADQMQEEGHQEWVLGTLTPSREVGIRHLGQDPPSQRPSMLQPHTAALWSRGGKAGRGTIDETQQSQASCCLQQVEGSLELLGWHA